MGKTSRIALAILLVVAVVAVLGGAAKEHGATHDRERQPLLPADGRDRPSAAATPKPAALALRTRRARHIPLGGVSVAALALVSKQVAAAREGLPAGGAAKRDRGAEARLTAVVVKQAHMVVEVPLRLQGRAADLAIEGLLGGKCGHVA